MVVRLCKCHFKVTFQTQLEGVHLKLPQRACSERMPVLASVSANIMGTTPIEVEGFRCDNENWQAGHVTPLIMLN